MPTYDYECRSCGHRVEVLHGVNESGPTACIRCGGPMRKLMSTPNIVFKGSGWAKKDARDARPAAKSGASSAKTDASDSSSGSDSSSKGESGLTGESAPATKAGDGAGTSGKKESTTSAPAAD